MSGSGTSGTSPASSNDNLSRAPKRARGPIMTGTGVAVVIIVAIVAVVAGFAGGYYAAPSKSSSSSTISITETGSSLLWPMMLNWSADYTNAINPNVQVSVGSTGSGTGQAESICGLVNIGASDTYITNASSATCTSTTPSITANMALLPVAISSQLIYYNLPSSVTSAGTLNINGTILGMIYNGNVTSWNAPIILAAQTPAVQTALNGLSGTALTIQPIARSDSSGDTGLFTNYIYMSWSGWSAHGHGNSKLSGTLNPHIAFEDLNSGVLTAIEEVPSSIGYVGVSYKSLATGITAANVGDNLARSASGGTDLSNYLPETTANVQQDVTLGLQSLNFASFGLAVNLVLGGNVAGPTTLVSGGGGRNPNATDPTPYPIANLEYTLVRTGAAGSPSGPGGTGTAYYVVQFLQWVISYGNLPQYLNPVGFLPLTPAVAGYDQQVLATIVVST